MKIITDEEVYIQIKDLESLIRQNVILPKHVLYCFNRAKNRAFNDFLKFEDPMEIEFFRSIDWICDYNVLKDYSLDKLLELEQETLKDGVMKNANDDEETKQIIDLINSKTIQKYLSITDIYKIKIGISDIKLPTEYSKNKVSKLIKTMFNKKIG